MLSDLLATWRAPAETHPTYNVRRSVSACNGALFSMIHIGKLGYRLVDLLRRKNCAGDPIERSLMIIGKAISRSMADRQTFKANRSVAIAEWQLLIA